MFDEVLLEVTQWDGVSEEKEQAADKRIQTGKYERNPTCTLYKVTHTHTYIYYLYNFENSIKYQTKRKKKQS